MGAELDRMSAEEIRRKHDQGVAVYILAQLNACSSSTIKKILSGEDYQWKPQRCKSIVVDVDEGRFYPSIRACERFEGICKNSLASCFSQHGGSVKFKGKRYHLYRRSKDEDIYKRVDQRKKRL